MRILLAVDGGPGLRSASSWWPGGRIRRLSDAARLLATVVALVLIAVLAAVVPGFAGALSPGPGGLPRTLLSIANAMASLAVLVTLAVVAVTAVRRRPYALVTAALACALGAAFALAAQAAGEAGWIAVLRAAEESAVVPIAAGTAFVVGTDAQSGPRLAGLASAAIAAATGCALLLGSLTLPGAAVAVLLGGAAGGTVRLAAGVVPARPPEDVVRAVLERAGITVPELRLLEQEAGRARYAATDRGGALEVTVVDPDRRGVTLARRLWRVLRFRTPAVGHPALSMRGVLERQSLVSALARSAGVAVPPVLALLAVGPALVLVERPLGGTRLAEAASSGTPLPADDLASSFRALRRLHDAGVAHGALTARSVVLTADGAGFTGLRAAQPAAGDLQRDLDLGALLVVVAASVGTQPALAAMSAGYGTGPAHRARLSALLQPLALTRPVRRAVRGTTVLADLRTSLTGPDARSAAHAPRLERIRARTVVSVAGATVGALVLAAQLSDVDIVSAVQQAQLSWLGVAVLGSALTYVGAALALDAFTPIRLPLVRSFLVQLASSFVTLVTPPTVGHVGINIRYLQRAGLPTPTAAAVVGVSQAVTVVLTLVLLVVSAWLSGVSPSRPSFLPSGEVLTVLLAAAALLGLAAAIPATRRLLRRVLEPILRRTLPQLLSAATDPRRLGTAALGVLLLNGGYVLALDASLRAFSAPVSLPTLVVVYLVASTVGSAAPTPGGLGAVEAALVGGLTATGVPVAAALAAVLAFRAATFWLPAPIGWVAFVGLQRRERI